MQMINCWWENISLYQCYLKIIKSLLTCSVNEIEIILTPVLHCPNSLASINMPYKDTGQGSKFKLHKKNEFPSKLEKVIFLKKTKMFRYVFIKDPCAIFFRIKIQKHTNIFFFKGFIIYIKLSGRQISFFWDIDICFHSMGSYL